ncbi:MAG: heavy metal-binding domain-containing protein [Kiritimatiellae bacterium]|jgi:uncharacterized protein YbjQ (UPF0145 family)|nr:heavy metal-binding domain-containing protein [Kiritimatiellia bacterium]
MNTPGTQLECPHCSAKLKLKAKSDFFRCPKCKKRFPLTDKGTQLLKFIVTSTDTIQGKEITSYLGLVSAQSVVGVNIFRDIMASVKDIVGGRSKTLEKALESARNTVVHDIRAKAIDIGADGVVRMAFDYETLGGTNGMLMVVGTGTAIKYSDKSKT